MKITPQIIELENRASKRCNEIARQFYNAFKDFKGKVRTAQEETTKAFEKIIPEIKEEGVRVFIDVSMYSISVNVNVSGPATEPDANGYSACHYARRYAYLGQFNPDNTVEWTEPKCNWPQFDYEKMKSDFKESKALEKKAKDLVSKYHTITRDAYFVE